MIWLLLHSFATFIFHYHEKWKDVRHNCFLKISTLTLIIFCDFLMVEQIFLSPQVKRSVIITDKLIYTSYRASKNYDLKKLGNIRKLENFKTSFRSPHRSPHRNKNFTCTIKNLLENRNWTPLAVHYPTPKPERLKYPANDCRHPPPPRMPPRSPKMTIISPPYQQIQIQAPVFLKSIDF